MTIHQIIRIEYGFAFAISFYIYLQLDFQIWMFFVFLLAPDITAIGYVFNKKVGSFVYNFGHNLISPLLLIISYFYFSKEYLLVISIIWLAHIFMDRSLGYGLKYADSFNKTHLQRI
jgi:hypothetical protein